MHLKKWTKLIAMLVLMIAVLLCAGACATAEVKVGRDGSGSATVVISKDAYATKEEAEAKVREILGGIDAKQSVESGRVKLKSFKEKEEGYVASISFKRLQYTSGIGNFGYTPSDEFLATLNKTTQIKDWAKGKLGTYQDYRDDIYKFAASNAEIAFRPVSVKTKTEMTAEEFIAPDGILSESSKGRVFTFFVADLEGLESVTFSFEGKIKVYGSKNAELVDSSTLRVKPIVVKSNVLSASGDEAATREVSCYAGYVYFTLSPSPVAIACGVIGGTLLVGFVVYGIVSGRFKRVFRGKTVKSVLTNYDLYLMMIPAIVLLVLFAYLPMAGTVMAFKNFKIDDGIWGSEWAGMGGFRNFVELFTKPTAGFGMLVRNTVLLALLKFVFGFLCAILLAVLFNYLKNGIFKKTVQTISYFPYFISWVTVSGLSYLFLATDGGLLNQMLAKIGVGAVNWYTSPQDWRGILTFTSLWKTVGYSTIVYLAAITAIDPCLYEAATIDGCGRRRQLLHITVPGMLPVIGIQVVFSLGNLVKDDFDQIYTMTRGSDALSSTKEVIGTIVYKSIGNASAYSSAAAMGILQGVVALILVLVSNRIIKKLGMDAAF